MLVNNASLATIFTDFSASFNRGFSNAPTACKQIAMTVPSNTRETNYGWLGQVASMREWAGPRVITNLSLHGYSIVNKNFEQAIGVDRNDSRTTNTACLARNLRTWAGRRPRCLISSPSAF